MWHAQDSLDAAWSVIFTRSKNGHSPLFVHPNHIVDGRAAQRAAQSLVPHVVGALQAGALVAAPIEHRVGGTVDAHGADDRGRRRT